MAIHLDTLPASDGQMDRIEQQYRALHALHADMR